MPQPQQIAPGRAVSLHLEVRLHDGFVALSTFDQAPITCTLGDGTLSPGLEAILMGLAPGADHQLLASGSGLFGDPDPANLHWLDLTAFPPDLDPTPGQLVAFTTPDGQETSGLVLKREGERVRVDFNHPLAGRSLNLRVRVLSVA